MFFVAPTPKPMIWGFGVAEGLCAGALSVSDGVAVDWVGAGLNVDGTGEEVTDAGADVVDAGADVTGIDVGADAVGLDVAGIDVAGAEVTGFDVAGADVVLAGAVGADVVLVVADADVVLDVADADVVLAVADADVVLAVGAELVVTAEAEVDVGTDIAEVDTVLGVVESDVGVSLGVTGSVNITITGELNPYPGSPTTSWPSTDALTITAPACVLVTSTVHKPVASVTHQGDDNDAKSSSTVKSARTPATPAVNGEAAFSSIAPNVTVFDVPTG